MTEKRQRKSRMTEKRQRKFYNDSNKSNEKSIMTKKQQKYLLKIPKRNHASATPEYIDDNHISIL